MGYLIGIFVFAAGACVGSFLNVVALRYNTGRSLAGRSGCFSCGHTLGFFDLIPILSFFFSAGRCRYCGSGVSLQYPLVEALVGLLFLGLYLKGFSLSSAVYLGVVFSLLTVILIYDIRHKIIPNPFVYAFITFSALPLFFNFETLVFSLPPLWHLLAGPILFAPFFFLWFISKGQWLGLGDGKLAWGIGWLLGLSSGGVALLIAVWAGAGVGMLFFIGQHLLSRGEKRLTMKSEVPFAPFMIFGALAVLFSGIDYPMLIQMLIQLFSL